MKLPNREYFTVHEVAARWGCTIADIAGWSATGSFEIVTGIRPVKCEDRMIGGEVIVCAFDILPMFRRCGTGPQFSRVCRVRTRGSDAWHSITEPVDGMEISVADLLISGKQVQNFEEKNLLFTRISAGTGSVSPYDWEGMLQNLALRVYERGLPASQAELVAEMQEWFVAHSEGGEVPDERSIRRRITPVWRELTRTPARA